jgi:hypothetical protein
MRHWSKKPNIANRRALSMPCNPARISLSGNGGGRYARTVLLKNVAAPDQPAEGKSARRCFKCPSMAYHRQRIPEQSGPCSGSEEILFSPTTIEDLTRYIGSVVDDHVKWTANGYRSVSPLRRAIRTSHRPADPTPQ